MRFSLLFLRPTSRVCAALVVLGVSLGIVEIVRAQTHPAIPKREVRAVWVSTAASLDWPKSFDRAEQQAALLKIVTNLKVANFNTIIFQARARGDAYYRSSYEPWAENLTGTLGKDPGWDPLEFLLTNAHKAGLEVHAWFNVYKVRGPSPVSESFPPHPARRFPAWTYDVDGDSWLDPGVPAVRNYLVRVALELVRNYDIDGIHFDFIRYPGKDFPDDATYRRHGYGMDRGDWRRANIDRFVSAFHDSAVRIKPMLKVGSAPLGVFSGGSSSNGWGAFYSYYQDSQGWLRKGMHDYLAPQLYWSLGSTQGDPDFAELLRSWRENSFGRQIWAGIAAYKPEVMREIPQQIDSSRSLMADGQSFFRYEHINTTAVLGGRYETLANIPPMPWKDSIPPLTPANLSVVETSANVFRLEWTAPLPAGDGNSARYYDIYRSTSPDVRQDDALSLVAITGFDETSFIDTVHSASSYKFYYAVSALDKGNNESMLSNVAGVTLEELKALSGRLSEFTTLSISIVPGSDVPALVAYQLAHRSTVSLQMQSQGGEPASMILLASGVKEPGMYVVGVRRERLVPGTYVLQLVADDATIEQSLEISK